MIKVVLIGSNTFTVDFLVAVTRLSKTGNGTPPKTGNWDLGSSADVQTELLVYFSQPAEAIGGCFYASVSRERDQTLVAQHMIELRHALLKLHSSVARHS